MLFGVAEVELTPAWFSLILQGGSFAVLVVLILYVVPKLRKEIADERRAELDAHAESLDKATEAFVKDSKEQRADFAKALEKSNDTFKAEAAAERAACEKHFETLANAVARGNDSTIQAIKTMSEQTQQHALRNQQWVEVLKAQVEKEKKAM